MNREAVGNSVDQKDDLSKVMKPMSLTTKTCPEIRLPVSPLATQQIKTFGGRGILRFG
jgi:hypothetical protein